MSVFESKYYSKTKFFLELLGLWPYQSSKRRWIGLILFYIITTSCIVPLILYLIFKKITFEIFVDNVSVISLVFISQLKYLFSFSSVSQLRALLSHIKKDWRQVTDQKELRILKNHAKEGQWISLLYILYLLSGLGSTITPLVLVSIETFFPLKNGSYPIIIPVVGEYLIFEQSNHVFLTCLHLFLGNVSTNFFFAGTDTIYLCTVEHVSGLFAIVCHRLENMFESDDVNVNMINNLKKTVELYNKCIRCCQLLEDSFSNCLFVILILCPVGIAGLSYQAHISNDVYVTWKALILLIGILTQVFYLNWVGQKIIDSSEKVFNSAYFSDWYLVPSNIQKSIIIIMCRTFNPHELTAGKMIILSMYTFGTLMRACSSILAVFAFAHQNMNVPQN